MRENMQTLARVVLCCVYVWLLEVGSYTVPVSGSAALLIATIFGVLTAYELAIRDVRAIRLAAAVAAVFAVVLGGFSLYRAHLPPPPTGPLRPAHDPTPRIACRDKPGPGDLVMAFGSNIVIGRGEGPFVPFKVADCPVLSLKRTPEGLTVSDVGYSYNNDIAFLIRDGVYRPLLPLTLRVLRPDASTFVLLDGYNQEVIYVRYLNPGAVRIRGRILCAEAPQAVILDDRILLGGIRMNGVTFGRRTLGPAHGCLTVPPSPPPVPAGRRQRIPAGG